MGFWSSCINHISARMNMRTSLRQNENIVLRLNKLNWLVTWLHGFSLQVLYSLFGYFLYRLMNIRFSLRHNENILLRLNTLNWLVTSPHGFSLQLLYPIFGSLFCTTIQKFAFWPHVKRCEFDYKIENKMRKVRWMLFMHYHTKTLANPDVHGLSYTNNLRRR